jgi:hypothetical protein
MKDFVDLRKSNYQNSTIRQYANEFYALQSAAFKLKWKSETIPKNGVEPKSHVSRKLKDQ